MTNHKLSIIVPVYNVAPYLRKCVDSLLAQDYSDYEIILVDDGSTDNSGSICDDYANTPHTSPITHHTCPIRVIHQPNGGLSAARNAGITIAKGEYICFVDSDDFWELNVLGGLMAQIERDNLDVLRLKYQNVNEKYEVVKPYKKDARLGNDYSEIPLDGISFLNSRMNTQCYAVMYIFKRELIEGCMFTQGIYFEDVDWAPRMLIRAERVASTNTIVYNYLIRNGSITNAINRSKQKKVLDDKMRLIGEMQKQANELQSKGLCNTWFDKMIAANVISIIALLSVTFYDERKSYLAELKKMNVFPLYGSSLKVRLANFSPYLTVKLLHLKNAK